MRLSNLILIKSPLVDGHHEILCKLRDHDSYLRFSRNNSTDTIQIFADCRQSYEEDQVTEIKELIEEKNHYVEGFLYVAQAKAAFLEAHAFFPTYESGDCQVFARYLITKLKEFASLKITEEEKKNIEVLLVELM